MTSRPNRLVFCICFGMTVISMVSHRPVVGQDGADFTPDSPEVRDMAAKAAQYLTDLPNPHPTLGGKCLRGLACYKFASRHPGSEIDPTDLKPVRQAKEAVREALARGIDMSEESINYSLGIAIVFLCEVDGKQGEYHPELERLLKHLYDNQRADGAWSYSDYKTGDTSETQYGVLATWYAIRNGNTVPPHSLARSVEWLVRTQDPTGAAPYQGNDPGNYNRIDQSDLRLSMSPAALSCFYITEELNGRAKPKSDGLFRSVAPVDKPIEIAVNQPMLRRAINDGDQFYLKNFKLNIGRNFHYYLYSLERYQSIRAFAEGRVDAPTPWYDAGVEHLLATQRNDGSWNGTRGTDVSTSFALMFLMRSMEAALEETAGGTAGGGFTLPADLTPLNDKDFRAADRSFNIPPPKEIGVEKLFGMFNNSDVENYTRIVPKLPPFGDAEKRQVQLTETRRFLRSGKAEERLVVARMLADENRLEHVPDLIFALTDGDRRVTKVARDGLRLVSRKFNGYGLGERPTADEKEHAARQWQRWYQQVRVDSLATR